MQKLIAAIALSLAWPAFATTPAPLVLDELVDVSEQVVLVRVTSGRLNSLTDDCGVRFVGQIETSWKGSHTLGATVEFGMAAAGIGETYVVYLVPHRHPKADVWASTNSDDARARSEWMKKCEGVLPPYRVAQRGIFRVWQRGHTKAERGLLFGKTHLLRLPTTLPLEAQGNLWYVPLEKFSEYLKVKTNP